MTGWTDQNFAASFKDTSSSAWSVFRVKNAVRWGLSTSRSNNHHLFLLHVWASSIIV